MDVFRLRNHLVQNYRNYAESFVAIRDGRVAERVRRSLDRGRLWPAPSLQMNLAFGSGGLADEFIAEGLLHRERAQIRCTENQPHTGSKGNLMLVHGHQAGAVRKAGPGRNDALATGTGCVDVSAAG